MTPRLRVTGKELIGALEQAGFEVSRIRGSHFFMRHADENNISSGSLW